jgi:hypothetical protein
VGVAGVQLSLFAKEISEQDEKGCHEIFASAFSAHVL